MECDVCNEITTNRNLVFSCDYCKIKYCKQCASLTSSEVKVLELKERILKFRCKKCDRYETHTLLNEKIEDKINIIKAKEELITLLRQKISEFETLKSECPTQISYSDIVQKEKCAQADIKPNIPSIIIKPKQRQNATKTEADIRTIRTGVFSLNVPIGMILKFLKKKLTKN